MLPVTPKISWLVGLLGLFSFVVAGCGSNPSEAVSDPADLNEFFEHSSAVDGQTIAATLDGRPVDDGPFAAGSTMTFELVVTPEDGKRVAGDALRIDNGALSTVNYYAIGGVDGTVTSGESSDEPAVAISSDRTEMFERGWFLQRTVDSEADSPANRSTVPVSLKPGEVLTFSCQTVLPTRPGVHTLAVVNQFQDEIDPETGSGVMRSLYRKAIRISAR